MSTILDALRKVEEENRTRNADARTRLLTTPQRFDLRPPRHQRVSWLVSTGLIVGGITLGAGLMGWERLTAPVAVHTGEEVVARTAVPTPLPISTASPDQGRPAVHPVVAPAPGTTQETLPTPVASSSTGSQGEKGNPTEPLQLQQNQVTPVAGGPFVGSVPPSPSNVIEIISPAQNVAIADTTSTLSTPGGEGNPIQRSPFINTVEPERMTPPPSPPSAEQRVATRAKPKPAPKPTPLSSTPAETVEPPSAALEESDIGEITSSASQEEEQEAVADETTSPPTQASVSFLQWSPEPEKRMAFIKVGNTPTTLAHEGDTVNGVRVVKIRQGTVELQSGASRWTLKAR